MARYSESRALARAIRRKGTALVHEHGQRIEKALVVQIDPLVVELMRYDIQVDDDHLLLGAWMRWYDQQVGIAVDDAVLVSKLADGDWLMIEVVTQSDFGGLLAPAPLFTASAPTFGSPQAVKLDPTPVRDLPEPETAAD